MLYSIVDIGNRWTIFKKYGHNDPVKIQMCFKVRYRIEPELPNCKSLGGRTKFIENMDSNKHLTDRTIWMIRLLESTIYSAF